MGVEVRIANPSRRGLLVVLGPGDEQAFGREVGGVGKIGEDRAVSRKHGIVRATSQGFDVTSTGSRMGFVVADRTTPSRLHIACGVGQITVPFADCSIIVEHERGRGYLNVTVHGSEPADRWAESWGPEMRLRWDATPSGRSGTQPPWPNVKWRKSNGVPYAWFTTLIGLCEPALGDAPAGTPTNPDLAQRLYLGENGIERHLASIYQAFGFEGRRHQREVIVAIAIHQGIVTRGDINLLPPRQVP